MRWSILTLLIVSNAGCSAQQSYQLDDAGRNRIANLKRAAQYPWMDDGRCAVREASGEWRTLVERCYYTLDLSRIQFGDRTHRCPVASVDASSAPALVGMCLMAQPEIVVGAVIVIGTVIVAAAILEEIQRYRESAQNQAQIAQMSKIRVQPRVIMLPDDKKCELKGSGGQGEICRYLCEGVDEIIEIIIPGTDCPGWGKRIPWKKIKGFPRR